MPRFLESLPIILIFGLVGAFFLSTAKKKGFFVSPYPATRQPNKIHWKSALIFFAIYFGMMLVVLPIFILFLRKLDQRFHFGEALSFLFGGAQLFALLSTFLLIFLYAKRNCPLSILKILKEHTSYSKSIGYDFFLGVITWIWSFPIVVVIGQVTDLFLYYLFHFEGYEQVAIRYLKNTLHSPFLLGIALFSILIAAPFLEEFLFRGCLQTMFRQWMGRSKAIFSSALSFSLFHFSFSQGLGNISLLLSLFAFALVLGWIYERQASLFASIGLHMTFNIVTTIRILLELYS